MKFSRMTLGKRLHAGFGLILAVGLYLFISERLRVDVTAMLILLALVLTGVLDSKQALSGFASEPAIIVAAVFVLGLFPDEPMRKTELAAKQFQQLVGTSRTGVRAAGEPGRGPAASENGAPRFARAGTGSAP